MPHSTISSILACKCPQCRQSNLFTQPNPYQLKAIAKMPEECAVCGLSFSQEVGFYWGAMYISYALTVGFSILNFLFVYLIWGWLTWQFLLENTVLLAVTFPLVFRYSRVLWLYLFIRYKP